MTLPMLSNEELQMDAETTRMSAAHLSYGDVGQMAAASLDPVSPLQTGIGQDRDASISVPS